ncbi:hypothetical protein HYFRA_00003597 [Hymenoscyphus fraxineus]|uniref:C2H2-type domain-containing protein n=1 Tax=Hymenoscyphus fraxineus TaxID=746836 RepID=A0A9N9L395_9HELO|nr:hypothetical protein HYFRA_00003597 [Hymenoscyphus fraxineus]
MANSGEDLITWVLRTIASTGDEGQFSRTRTSQFMFPAGQYSSFYLTQLVLMGRSPEMRLNTHLAEWSSHLQSELDRAPRTDLQLGIAIEDLFELVTSCADIDHDSNEVWQELLRRPEVVVEPGKSGEDLRQLILTNLLASDHGRSIIKAPLAVPPAPDVAAQPEKSKKKGRPKLPRAADGSIIRNLGLPKPALMTPSDILLSSPAASATGPGRRTRKPPPSIYEEIGHTTLVPDSVLVDKRPYSTRRHEAVYTSYEELQRQAGVPGVYFEEKVSDERRKDIKQKIREAKVSKQTNHQPASSHVLVFKSGNLKDQHWLVANTGTWVEPFSAAIAAATLEAENEQERKRQKNKSTAVKNNSSVQNAKNFSGADDPGTVIDPLLLASATLGGDTPTGESISAGSNLPSPQANPSTPNEQHEHSPGTPGGLAVQTTNLAMLNGPYQKPVTAISHSMQAPALSTQESLESTIIVDPIVQTASETTPKPKRTYVKKAQKAQMEALANTSTTPNNGKRRGRKSDTAVGQLSTGESSTPPGKKHRITTDIQTGPSHQNDLLDEGSTPMSSLPYPALPVDRHLSQSSDQQPPSYSTPYYDHECSPSNGTPLAQLPGTPITNLNDSITDEMTSSAIITANSYQADMGPGGYEHVSNVSHSLNGFSDTPLVQASSTSNRSASPLAGQGLDPTFISQQLNEMAQPKKGRPKKEVAQLQRTIENALVTAQDIPVSKEVYRLAAVYEGVVGNLVLSVDKTTLHFYGLDQYPPQLPLLQLPVQSVTQNPIASAQGSYPMELLISSRGNTETGEVVSHRFQFASTPQGSEAAKDMRSKLVQALLAIKLKAGLPVLAAATVVSEEVLRPWSCETCSRRFKNDIGLKYHVTKSQTTCNPNWDPVANPAKKRGKPALSAAERAAKKRRDSFSGDESFESDGPVSKPRGPRKEKRYVNLPRENELLDAIALEYAEVIPDSGDSALNLTSMDDFQDLVLDMVRNSGGVFPAEKSVWIAGVGAWLKHGKKPDTSLPESKCLRQALEDLVYDRKLVKIPFNFRDSFSRGVKRNILAEPEFDRKSPLVNQLRDAIKGAHPNFYVPPEYCAPDSVMERLQIAARRIAGNVPEIDYDILNELDEDLDLAAKNSADDDEFRAFEMEHGEHIDSDEFMSDGDDPEETSRKQQRLMELKVNKSRALKRKWHASKLAGNKILSKVGDGQGSPKRRRTTYKPRKPSKKDSTWDATLAFLPDPQTGAWGHSLQQPKIKEFRFRPQYRRPEPITFMQGPNGSWSERPFGHGVNPSFARPNRLAQKDDVHATKGYYQHRVDKGFRPVVFPPSTSEEFVPVRRSSTTPSFDLEHSVELSSDTTPRNSRKRGATESAEALYYRENGFPKRVSRNTGLPVRRYKPRYSGARRGSTASLDEVDDLSFTPLPPTQSKRNTRNSARAAAAEGLTPPALEELDLDIDLLRPENPGLRSMPANFGLDRSFAETELQNNADYNPNYSEIQWVEPQATFEDCDFNEGSWVQKLEDTAPLVNNWKVKWRKTSTLDMESIPYEDLRDEPEGYVGIPQRGGAKPQGPNGTRLTKPYQKKVLDPRFTKKRKTTAKPSDFEGLIKDISEVPKKFGVECAPKDPVSGRREGRNMDARLPPRIERRLVSAIIAVKTITGGIHSKIDWILLVQLFPMYSTAYLTRFWKNISIVYVDAIEEATEKFRELFPEAYRKGEVPPIDYDHLLKYDWEAVINWILTTIKPVLKTHNLFLPGTLEEVNTQIKIIPSKKPMTVERGGYFDLNTALYRRLKVASSKPGVISVAKPKKLTEEEEANEALFMLAKSWVRAVATTPDRHWDATVAGSKLIDLGDKLVDQAIVALKDEKIIRHTKRGHAAPGRNYEVTDFFNKKLQRHIPPQQFLEAMEYKRFLDEKFLENRDQAIRIDYLANEGTLLCISTLQAHGQIRTKDENINCHHMKGLKEEDFYSTERIPKSRLIFQMDIYFTPLYTLNDSIPLLQKAITRDPIMRPPAVKETGEIPLWRDINDKTNTELWALVLVGLSQMIALRSGIDVKGLKKAFDPLLEEWEIREFLQWGVRMGIFRKLHERFEGWTVIPEWWMIVGAMMEGKVTTTRKEKPKFTRKKRNGKAVVQANEMAKANHEKAIAKEKGKGKEKV